MPNDSGRVGDVGAMLRLMEPLDGLPTSDPNLRKRQLVADLIRFIGNQTSDSPTPLLRNHGLSPRMEQTLRSLLRGESEKQAAAEMGVSQHTVHVYVKQLYRKYGVSSRAELLSKWVSK